MDIEDRLKQLQSLFSHALSAAVAAKAQYLALAGELASTPAALARAKTKWQQLEAQKAAIIARMVALEELEHDDDSSEGNARGSGPPSRSSGFTWRNYLRSWTKRAGPFSSNDKPWHTSRAWWVPSA